MSRWSFTSSGQTPFLLRSNLWSKDRFFLFSPTALYCTLLHHPAPPCTTLHFTLFSLEVVKPSGGERWWAPDQHPMCPCGCSPRIDQVRSLAASAQAQFRSHSTMLHFFAAPSCTLLHHPAPHCTLLHHTALLTSHVEVVFHLVRSNSFPP